MYNFGQAVSLPFYTQTWTPDSWYDRLEENLKYGMHTLVLLDIKVREQSEENMARCVPLGSADGRGRLIYEPPRFMNPATAFEQILLTEGKRHPAEGAEVDEDDEVKPSGPTLMDPEKTLAMSLSRIGTATQRIIAGTVAELGQLTAEDYGAPLHSVVIVGKRIHPLELEFAGRWCVGGENGNWWKVAKDVYGVERETFE